MHFPVPGTFQSYATAFLSSILLLSFVPSVIIRPNDKGLSESQVLHQILEALFQAINDDE